VRDSRGSWRIGRRRTGRKTGEHGNGRRRTVDQRMNLSIE
jgi:hypothetical protein